MIRTTEGLRGYAGPVDVIGYRKRRWWQLWKPRYQQRVITRAWAVDGKNGVVRLWSRRA